jgi:hypothetical protein
MIRFEFKFKFEMTKIKCFSGRSKLVDIDKTGHWSLPKWTKSFTHYCLFPCNYVIDCRILYKTVHYHYFLENIVYWCWSFCAFFQNLISYAWWVELKLNWGFFEHIMLLGFTLFTAIYAKVLDCVKSLKRNCTVETK